MKKENLKYYKLDKIFRKVLATERTPERTKEGWRSEPFYASQEVFAMTDNGMAIAYYDYDDKEWRTSTRDNFTEVVYWLEEI